MMQLYISWNLNLLYPTENFFKQNTWTILSFREVVVAWLGYIETNGALKYKLANTLNHNTFKW